MKTTHSAFAVCAKGSAYAAIGKHLLLLLFVTGISAAAYAQRTPHERINIIKDKVEYLGYSIRPIVAMGGSLGYDIMKGNKLLMHQYRPPVMSMRLYKKEDVYKVAQWTIRQYAKTRHFPSAIPATALKDLHLSSTH